MALRSGEEPDTDDRRPAASAPSAPSAPRASATSPTPPVTSGAGAVPTGLVFTVLVLGGLLVVLDITIINVAIRTLAEDLDATLPVIQWVSTAYTLALAVTVPTSAWLVGRFGARRIYTAALAAFVLGSALCGLAWDVGSLIAFRVLQGIGGGLVQPVAMMIVLRATPPERRGRAMGLLGLPVLVGPVIGPTLGGSLVEFSWRWIFLVNLPVGILALLLAARALRPFTAAPASAATSASAAGSADTGSPRERLDLFGLGLIAPGLALFVYGLAESGRQGTVASAVVLVPALAGIALVAGFAVRAARVPAPLVRITLLRRQAVGSSALTLALFAAAYFGSMLVLPLYLQAARGLSPAATGMLGIPQALATGISLQVASRLVDRVPPARIVGFGIALATCGLFTVLLLLDADTPYWQLVVALSVMGIGAGSTIMPTITTALRHLDDRDAPSGSTLLTITNQVSVSIGTALTSVVLASGLATRGLGSLIGGGEAAGPLDVGDPGQAGGGTAGAGAADTAAQLAEAFRNTLGVPVGLMAAALVVALTSLPRGGGRAHIRPAGGQVDVEVGPAEPATAPDR
ncbi:DHA2 family efflux MFS transporter permease subunit [Frankia sp. Cpl3]|uniref:DHA2 family efflux MFS transporter permease subunit n=1 Tax=Parafrankia colletiae TaxID=573497 RepID=UPI000B19A3F7|nr:DHA2 family efflux MFS transporter permease subunit [Parafrankia colletiae]MCK9901750.1 DHA2 family efflux MFS transporter permease subunit [Frankia sp. Cpl3]